MKTLILFILIPLMLIGYALPVYADQADPDSTPTVEQINVYRNLLETGDKFYLIYANIPYSAPLPDATEPEAFIWQLIGTDNSTVLGQATGYAYNDSGYGYNVYGMYFDSTENVTWNSLYQIKLVGNPAIFDTPKEYYYPLALSDYTTLTTTADNQASLAARIINLAGQLDIRWALTATYSLLYEAEGSTVLSIFGEAFFRGAIYGVQALAPAAFRMVVSDIDAEDRTWTSGYSDNLSSQFSGTWIEPAKTGGGTLFGVGYDLTSIIITFICCVLLIVGNMKLTNDAWNACIDIAIVLVCFPRIDMIPLSFTALICALFIMYEGTKVKAFVR